GTGSSQTVCQMPVTGVYQIPPGLLTCLPRGCAAPSVGSHTRTSSSFFPGLSASVMSKENGAEPPLCPSASLSPSTGISVPLTSTVVCQSTASKWRSTRLSFHPAGTSNVREYQSTCFEVSCLPTPESADSIGKGTRICPSHFVGGPAPCVLMA